MDIINNKALLIRTRTPEKITQVIQQSQIIREVPDIGYEVLVKWTLHNTVLLHMLGFKKAPSPIEGQYEWPGMFKPFAHQKVTASFLTMHKRAFCLNDMGSGKTNSVVWAADYLLTKKIINRVLIVCPLSIMDTAWRADLFKTAMHRRVDIAHGAKGKRIKVIQSDAEFVIINYDGIEIVADEIAKGGFDLIVCDEASALKVPTTRRWKTLNSLIGQDTWLWLLTGTPAAQSPMDAYGLAKIVNPNSVPKYIGAFKDQVMLRLTQFKYVPRKDAQATVYKVLQPAIRFTKEECLDLPELVYVERDTPITPQQKKYYDLLKKEMLFEAAGEEVSAVNAAVKMNKLLQISCIAYNTPVLTDAGWIPIQNVTTAHKVWDGEEWVTQEGAIFRGVKEVEACWGVSMTDDHLVLTTDGWIEMGDIIDGKSSVKFTRAKVRLPDSCSESGHHSGHCDPVCDMAVSVRLWQSSCPPQSIFEGNAQKIPEKLRMPPRERNPQNEQQTRILQLLRDVGTVLRSSRQRLQKLRSAWDNRMRTMESVVYEFLERHGANTPTWPYLRQNRQQRTVFTRELSMGYSATTGEQHSGKHKYSYPEGTHDHSASCRGIWNQECYTAGSIEKRMVNKFSTNSSAKQRQRTYDLLNCGPRSRFVVGGSDGALIVHNCGSVYSDTGEVIEFDCSARLKEMTEVIEQSSHKVLIFANFKHGIVTIKKHLDKLGITSDIIHGGVTASNRAKIFNDFQTTQDIKVLIIQPKAAAHGVTLHAANTIIWWGPITSTETYLQANARVHRAGQKNPCTVVHLVGSQVERTLYTNLTNMTNAQTTLLDMYKNIIGLD